MLQGESPDRLPMDYWATEETTDKLLQYLGCDDRRMLYERLHIDAVFSVAAVYSGPPLPAATDAFGCGHREMDYGTGVYSECISHPLAQYTSIEEIESQYSWPSPDWYDYSGVAAAAAAWSDYPIRGGGSEPFLTYKKLRGEEQAFVDLIECPEMVHYCLDRLFELAYENTARIYEQIPGQVVLSYVAEDMGSQTGLMFSPPKIREFLLPGMQRMVDLAHQAGVYVFHHNDGAIREILPDLVAMGIDVLNPIQWRCSGMAREELKREFGGDVVFHGGVDNQYTLAFGSVDEVCLEVRDNIRILGDGGGYILAPCHNIQAVSPPENIVAMYETGFAERA